MSPAARRYEQSVLVRATGAVLLAGVVLSLVLHGLAALALFDRPIGYIAISTERDRQPMRVVRARVDRIVSPGAINAAVTESPLDTPPADDLASELLAEAPATPEPTEDPEVQLRDLAEEAPASDLTDLDIPAFEIPGDVLAQLEGDRPDELAYSDAAVDLPSSRTSSGGDPADAARQLLAGAGYGIGGEGTGAGRASARSGGNAPAAVQPPGLDAALAPAVDQTLRELPDAPAPIDFVGIALDDTRQIVVPEHLDNDFDYQLTRWNDFFQVEIAAKRSLRKLQTMPKDVVLLVDTSSSIPQDWVQRVVSGIKHGLHSLNDNDRFNIVLFNEQIRFFSTDGAVDASPKNIEAAKAWIDDARARGFTDVNAALTGLLRRDIEQDRVYNLVLISDGRPTRGVIDTRELINRITRDNDLAASIYCVGIGPPRTQNRELLDFLAYRNRGYCLFADDREQATSAILDLLSRIRFPLIKDLKLHVAGVDAEQVYPADLPNIHQGERFSVFGRFAQPGPFTVQITGQSAGQPVDFTFTRDLSQAPLGDRTIGDQWAFWKLHHLYSEIIRRGETDALLAEIRELRRQYGLKTLY